MNKLYATHDFEQIFSNEGLFWGCKKYFETFCISMMIQSWTVEFNTQQAEKP